MLSIKIDRLNTLSATLDEINEIKSQLLAELKRIETIESETISEVSDIQSEILTTTFIVVPDPLLAADIKLEDCTIIAPDKWEQIEGHSRVLCNDNIIYVWEEGNLIDASTIHEGASNSPLQKAVDRLRGYHEARYGLGNYLPELDPCYNPESGKKGRLHWWGNHARKQVWYDYLIHQEEYWYIDWQCTDPKYWIELAKANFLDIRRKGQKTLPQIREYHRKQIEENGYVPVWADHSRGRFKV